MNADQFDIIWNYADNEPAQWKDEIGHELQILIEFELFRKLLINSIRQSCRQAMEEQIPVEQMPKGQSNAGKMMITMIVGTYMPMMRRLIQDGFEKRRHLGSKVRAVRLWPIN